ncbi:MAG: AI-2E family transporter [Oligoflexia bacterium]|nr:AI-2E family transporter [Oligoflexia bacterium]
MILSPQEVRQKVIKRIGLIKLLAFLLIITTAMVIVLAIPGMLGAFILAFVITFVFKPFVSFFERKGLSTTWAVSIPFLVSSVLVAGSVTLLLPILVQQISTLQAEVPKYISQVSDMTKAKSLTINTVLSQFTDIDIAEQVMSYVQKSSTEFLTTLPNAISLALSTLILAPFFAFFMLSDGRMFSKKLLAFVPNNLFELALNLHFQINRQMGGFIRARILESALVGGIVWIGFLIIGFPYAAFLALLAGVTNIIPYIGPIIGAAPAIVIAFANGYSALMIGIVIAIYVLAQVLDMLLVIPLVVAKIVNLHAVTVVVVIIIGGQIMGILGMIISIPVASIIKLIFTEFYNHIVDFRS